MVAKIYINYQNCNIGDQILGKDAIVFPDHLTNSADIIALQLIL